MGTENMSFMKVNDVAEVMGISKSLAYEYLQSEECPFTVLRINSRYIVPYNSFCTWYNSLAKDGRESK